MSTTLVTVLIAIFFVAFLIFSLSITLIRKGHHIQSEVGENDEMKKRGIKCASHEMMEEERALGRDVCGELVSCGGTCDTCETNTDQKA